MPDKTALAALVLATRHRPLPVFFGASLALTIQSVVAVLAASLLALLPQRIVHIGDVWKTLWTVFVVVFIAEWGDLTQIGTASLQAKYHSWPTILVASALALWAVAALAVFVGSRASRLLDPKLTQKIAAAVFAVIGVLLIVGVL